MICIETVILLNVYFVETVIQLEGFICIESDSTRRFHLY